MSSAIAHRISLACHPATPNDAIKALDVQVSVSESGVFTFGYSLQADMARLRVPSGEAEGRVDGLWKHTCFEAFIAPGGSRAYYELNFSPAKQWAAYRFNAYREGMSPLHLAQLPQISTHRSMHSLELDAVVRLPIITAAAAARRLRLAPCAVLEEENGRLSFWAARHAAGKPDFHHLEGFAFEL